MELLAGKQVASGAGLLLLEQGANQGKGSVEDGKQGKRCKALKGSDPSAQTLAGGSRWRQTDGLVWPGFRPGDPGHSDRWHPPPGQFILT